VSKRPWRLCDTLRVSGDRLQHDHRTRPRSCCAVGTSVAFLLKHRGAVLAPPVRVRHPLRSAVDLFRSSVEVIALTSVAANLIAIVGGILVFRDPVGAGGVEITARMAAFCLVIVGAALIPAPTRATREPSY
jgi:hypothetical protein